MRQRVCFLYFTKAQCFVVMSEYKLKVAPLQIRSYLYNHTVYMNNSMNRGFESKAFIAKMNKRTKQTTLSSYSI